MALRRSTARRYAEAAFEIAVRDDAVEAWLRALSVAEERLSDEQVARVLASPAVPVASRLELLDRLLGDTASGGPRNLVALLIRRGRFDDLGAVVRELRRLDARRRGLVEAVVTSAAPLDDTERAALAERLTSMTGQTIHTEERVDPELLGGLQVRIGDRLIDGSVRGRLERLRASLATSAS
jgi:F-type H+-transporting ATPase subunit delta